MSVERGFDSPIDKYLPLPIIIYSGLSPEEKYRIKNRPRLSNITDFFGFRTSEAAPPPILNSVLKVHPVLPCPSILCPSSPRVEKSRATHSDLSYGKSTIPSDTSAELEMGKENTTNEIAETLVGIKRKK